MSNVIHLHMHTHTHTRVIIGAPLGTFPGGLGYPDDFEARENATGLVYNCPVSPGGCVGVRGDTTAYLGSADVANGVNRVSTNNPSLAGINTEGRLFDQARKYWWMCTCSPTWVGIQ